MKKILGGVSLKIVACFVAVCVTSMTQFPSSAQAMLVPSRLAQVDSGANSTADLHTIEKALESKALTGKLHALGLSDAEIQARLARLSDQQKHQLASQIRAVNPAGDGGSFIVGVLIIAVLVLLIVYLAKRI